MRGTGQTALMIANLPSRQCTVVVPTADIGRLVAERVHKTNPGHRRYVVINRQADVKKLLGLSEPIFFDHSFFDLVDEVTAKSAVQFAIPCVWCERVSEAA